MSGSSAGEPARDDARRAGRREGERRRDVALTLLETLRARVILMGRRVMLGVMLERGEATADDVYAGVTLPHGVRAVCLGAVPRPLSTARIIDRTTRRVRSSRERRHACDIPVWRLVDRDAAERWLAEHPPPPDDTGPATVIAEPALDYCI